ncbi:MAG: ABC transporter permease [Chitinophagales bacterium]|nr:ABC transporter permease [Chitinophagales bacterium]
MIRNYLKIAFRNLLKDKQHALINIVGLSLGMMVAILIMAYIYHEVKVDQSLPDKEEVGRVYRQWEKAKSLIIPSPLAPALRNEIDAIESATNIGYAREGLVVIDNQSQYIQDVAVADSAFFSVFRWAFKYGNREQAFEQLNSVVLSTATAERLFGDTNPIGKTLKYNDEVLCKVTGVLEPFEGESHLDYQMIAYIPMHSSSWTGASGLVYVRKLATSDTEDIESSMTAMANAYVRQEYLDDGEKIDEKRLPEWKIQPLQDIHLYSAQMKWNAYRGGDIRQIRMLSGLALIVLLLAGINYVNLATARSSRRSREVGMRKVMGASRVQVRSQFLAESLLQAFIALILAATLAELMMPIFNQLVDRDLSLLLILASPFPFYLLLLALATGFLSGIYPAIFLERQQPVHTIQGKSYKGKHTSTFRKALVVFQFTLSTALVIFIVIIWQQMEYITNQELGFNGDQVLVAEINTEDGMERLSRQKDAILQLPGVQSVSNVSGVPGDFSPDYGMELEGREENISAMMFFVDEGFDEVLQLEVTDGRFFDKMHPSDSIESFIVNESFVEAFGLDNPLEKRIRFPYEEESFGNIVGVVKDFHYRSLDSKIQPAIMSMRTDIGWLAQVAVRLDGQQIAASIHAIEGFWKQVEPQHPVKYHFLDEHFAQQYSNYYQLQKTVLYTSLLSILVAILGLFGLASFMAEQRTKEISVRKVLGASVQQLAALLVNAHLRLIFIAGLIAIPIAYFLANRWLQNFAARIELGVLPFILVLSGILVLAILTVGFKAIRVALANPAEHLKVE